MKKVFSLVGGVCAALALGIFLFLCVLICLNPYNTHNVLLQDEVKKLNQTQEFVLNDIVPFEWDMMYVFEKGTDKEYIEKTIGISNKFIKSVPNEENAVSIIFMCEGKITAYPQGTKEDLGYYIDIPLNKEKHTEVNFEEHLVCYVESENGIAKIMDLYEYLVKIY